MAEFEKYAGNVRSIWEQDKPQLSADYSTDSIYIRFREQYQTIRTLAGENKVMVRSLLMPFFRGEREVEEADAEFLESVCATLGSIQNLESIDRILSLKCRRLLVSFYRRTGNRESLLKHLSNMSLICYFTAFALNRCCLLEPDELFFRYNDEGISYISEMLSYLDPKKFEALNRYEKFLVLQSAGHAFMFQQGPSFSESNLRYKLDSAVYALKLSRDPYYRSAVPDFRWADFEHYCLYYVAMCSEYICWGGTKPGYLQTMREACEELQKLHEEGKVIPGVDYNTLERLGVATRMFQGEITTEEYQAYLFKEYHERNRDSYELFDVTQNMLLPGKLQDEQIRLMTYEGRQPSDTIGPVYWDILEYTRKAPHTIAQEALLNYLQAVMADFIDVPGGPAFSEMAGTVMANCSVPTTIHSRMVGQLAKILVKELLALHPEQLIGFCGCESAEEVLTHREEILDFTEKCGMFHDLGKLSYLDIVGITYRDFFDEEFDAIKRHPFVGWQMLGKHADTAPYAMTALGHHRWYNEQGGYPAEYHRAEDPCAVITDLIAVADCLDAATDTIFRSYNPGITLEKFIGEVVSGAGTRYSPLGAELLQPESVREALRRELSVGREQAYETIWHNALTASQ